MINILIGSHIPHILFFAYLTRLQCSPGPHLGISSPVYDVKGYHRPHIKPYKPW